MARCVGRLLNEKFGASFFKNLVGFVVAVLFIQFMIVMGL